MIARNLITIRSFATYSEIVGLVNKYCCGASLDPVSNFIIARSKVSGLGEMRFTHCQALDCEVELSQPGDYILQLTSSEGAYRVCDQVKIHYRLE